MSHPNPSTALAVAVVDELARHGVRQAVISPGSRSTALVLALDAHPGIDTIVHIDERSAGFRALGSSLATGVPAVVVTTSGSAVANLLPAVVEADRAGVAMVVLTGDRPAELIARRANQTMDHSAVTSGFVRALVDLGPGSAAIDGDARWRSEVSDAMYLAVGASFPGPGPIHLNLRFEEPTVAYTDDGRTAGRIYPHTTPGAPNGNRYTEPAPPDPIGLPDLPDLGPRVIVLVGSGRHASDEIVEMAVARGAVAAATATSGGRGNGAIARYHHILVNGVPDPLRPTGVVVAGRVNPAERLLGLTTLGLPVVHVDGWGIFSDPAGTKTMGVIANPASVVATIGQQEEGWSSSWSTADIHLGEVVGRSLRSSESLTGPLIAESLNGMSWETLMVGSSLPIRDVDAHLTRGGQVFANRGVSGIDGFNSTFLGVAGQSRRSLAVVGDLSFLHDSNGFLTDTTPDGVIVVVDNGGGGLFDLLPQARLAPNFERYFVTPHGRDLSQLTAFHGLPYTDVGAPEDLIPVVEKALETQGMSVVRVGVGRDVDASQRASLDRLATDHLVEMLGPWPSDVSR